MTEVRHIGLTRGFSATVDAGDYDWLMQWKWCAKEAGAGIFYAFRMHWKRGEKQKGIRMHRAIIGAPDSAKVDHINRDGLDNRRANLRVCTQAQNTLNRCANKGDKSSAFKGVCWHRGGKKWMATFRDQYLGLYSGEEAAAHAYDAAAFRYSPDFAFLNFPSRK